MADIAATATKHVTRKNLRDQRFECVTCAEEKPFQDFIALSCGHALMRQSCHESNVAYLRAHPGPRDNCTLNCDVPRYRYHRVTEHSDYAPLFMPDATGDQQGNHQPAATGSRSNCYLITGFRQMLLENKPAKIKPV